MSKELKIGIISIVTIALFYWLFIFLNGKNVFTSGEIYYVTYENVDGLLPTKPVNVNGLKVGSVEDINIIQGKDSLYFVVKLVLTKKIDFTKNTVAEIYEPGLMAGKQIRLNLSYEGEIAKSGDTLRAANNQSLMSMLSNKLKPTQNKVDSVLVTLNKTLDRYGNLADDNTNKSLKEVLISLNKTIISLEKTANNVTELALSARRVTSVLEAKVSTIADNTNNTMISANTTLKKIGNLTEKLNDGKLDNTLTNLQQSTEELKKFMTKIENPDGSLGKVVNDPELYNNLNKTAENLNLLIQDLKQKPDRYFQFSIFGKKVKYKEDSLKK